MVKWKKIKAHFLRYEDKRKKSGTGRLRVPHCYNLLRSILASHSEIIPEHLSEGGGHLVLQNPPEQDKTEPQNLLVQTDSRDVYATPIHSLETYPHSSSTNTHQVDSHTHIEKQNKPTDPPSIQHQPPLKKARMESIHEAYQKGTANCHRIEEQNDKLLEASTEGINLVSKLTAAIEKSNEFAEERNQILRERNEIIRQYCRSKS